MNENCKFIFSINITSANFVTVAVGMANAKCTFIIDTGADVSIFKANKLKHDQPVNTKKQFNLTGVTNGTLKTLAETETKIYFSNGLTVSHNFQIVPSNFPILTDGLLGRDFLIKYKCTINYEHWLLNFNFQDHLVEVPIEDNIDNTLVIPARCEIIRRIAKINVSEDSIVVSQEVQPGVFCGNSIISEQSKYVKFINTTNKQVLIQNFVPKIEPLKNYAILSNTKHKLDQNRTNEILQNINFEEIPNYAHEQLRKLIQKFSDIFCLPKDKLTTNNFYSQNINLTDQGAVYIPNYKTLHAQKPEIKNQIDKMMNDNIIEPSISNYNSPILLVPKKSDEGSKKWRLVVDFRQLNKKLLADKFPLPRIDTILDQLGRAKYFSTLDLMSGFHQIPLKEECRKYTAFSTDSGHYQFKRLPFGLNISPNSFQRMMAIAMAGLTPEIAFVYIDDIIVIGCSLDHHLKNLNTVFGRLRHYNLKLNPPKCKFFKSEVTFLGHKVTDKGILPDDSKYETLVKYPVPQNADEVRRFVAFCNYYRKFIENFSLIAHPLNSLLKKNCIFEWTYECQHAFDTLKQKLLSPKILQYPDFSKTFIVTTDASNIGCGAILSQISNEGDLPIAYASRNFTPGEKNKSVILKELTAIHWAVNYFKSYLYGNRFTIRTDHRPLVHLFGMKDPTSKLTQMRLDLGEFDFDVVYIAGKANVGADALSRIVLTSDQLKNMNILAINTRSMTKKAQNNNTRDTQINISADHQASYTEENINEINKLCNLRTHANIVEVYHKSKRIMKIMFQRKIESSNLALTLSEVEKQLIKRNIYKVSISIYDDIFKEMSCSEVKNIANKTLQTIQIILYTPPKLIKHSAEIKQILENHHNSPTGGHVGQHRMYLRIRNLYNWKDMKGSIAQFVKACELCKRNKIIKHTKQPAIVTTTPSKPFEVITIDTVGPLPKTNKNNRYVVTIQCELSKYIVLAPVPNKEANTISKTIIENFILIYGKFLEVRSDQGTEYNNEILSQICKQLNIKQTFATAYHDTYKNLM